MQHIGNATEQAVSLSAAALTFLEARRMRRQGPAGERDKRLTRLGDLARQLRLLMGDDILDLLPPDIGHSPAVRLLYGIAPGMEKIDWPAVKAAARQAKADLACELPRLLEVLEAATKHESSRVAATKKPGRRPDIDRNDFTRRCMAVFNDATGRNGMATSRQTLTNIRGGPAPRFLACVCKLLLARFHESEMELREELSMAANPESAALWIEEAGRIRGKVVGK